MDGIQTYTPPQNPTAGCYLDFSTFGDAVVRVWMLDASRRSITLVMRLLMYLWELGSFIFTPSLVIVLIKLLQVKKERKYGYRRVAVAVGRGSCWLQLYKRIEHMYISLYPQPTSTRFKIKVVLTDTDVCDHGLMAAQALSLVGVDDLPYLIVPQWICGIPPGGGELLVGGFLGPFSIPFLAGVLQS